MRVLLVGSGGREAALARTLGASPLLKALLAAPGNPGLAARVHPVAVDNVAGLVGLARSEGVDLVVVGPELPLSLGLADALAGAGIPCFGPGARAARIESSKAFAKAFMERHGIPTARARAFSTADEALAFAAGFGILPVVKASGLAGGKGVILPTSDAELRAAVKGLLALGGRGAEILVEERLVGEELSLLALSDGARWFLLPPARDYKRLLDGDGGPNTGGMGSYAPAVSMESAKALAEVVIAPAIEGLASEGTPFVGALFAGLMLTPEGPRVLEYNCRFGDPELQAILPLFEGDLLTLLHGAALGHLPGAAAAWKPGAASCVVLASQGYPDSPRTGEPLSLPADLPDAWVLHAGTARAPEGLRSAGGRVVNLVGVGSTIAEASQKALALAALVGLDGAHYRRDIGTRGSLEEAAQASLSAHGKRGTAYARAGVDIDAGNRAVALMKDAVRSTYGPEVLAGIGAFGGLYEASSLKGLERPVLVASTDGVGTKTSLGIALGRLRGLGHDMVNHSIDDILVQGARPLFFLDYVAASRLVPETVAEIVSGMAEACREAGCALLGGETAEMPGTYREGQVDIAGTLVGVVEADKALPRRDLVPGDVLVGLPSTGLHTNGYSLARRALASQDLEAVHPRLGETLADALLRPHRSYLRVLRPALDAFPSPVKALVHITGGGMVENIPRVLPPELDAVVRRGSWPVPALFEIIREHGGVSEEEMARVFNLGIGMVVVVAAAELDAFERLVGGDCQVIGSLEPGSRRTRLV